MERRKYQKKTRYSEGSVPEMAPEQSAVRQAMAMNETKFFVSGQVDDANNWCDYKEASRAS